MHLLHLLLIGPWWGDVKWVDPEQIRHFDEKNTLLQIVVWAAESIGTRAYALEQVTVTGRSSIKGGRCMSIDATAADDLNAIWKSKSYQNHIRSYSCNDDPSYMDIFQMQCWFSTIRWQRSLLVARHLHLWQQQNTNGIFIHAPNYGLHLVFAPWMVEICFSLISFFFCFIWKEMSCPFIGTGQLECGGLLKLYGHPSHWTWFLLARL